MKRFVTIIYILAALIWCTAACAQAPGKKWALLVGVEAYKNPDVSRLEFAVNDVSALAAAKPEGAQIEGSAALFACSDGERAFEDAAKQHGIFTYYLLDALAGKGLTGNGPLTIPDAADYTRSQVVAWARDHNEMEAPELLSLGAPELVLADNVITGNKPVGGTVADVPTTAQLRFETTPPGEKISIDGKDTGKVSPAIVELAMAQSTQPFDVRLVQPGYRAVAMKPILELGKQTPTERTLQRLASEPKPGGGKLAPARTNPQDGAKMVLIPAGDFLMGDNDRHDNPRRRVHLDAYYIYKYPVTVKQYMKFCANSGHAKPKEPSFGWRDDDPIVNVSWNDANDYCTWAAKRGVAVRLPKEAEWEKAARGAEGLKYPWGDTWDASKCVNSVAPASAMRTESVYSHPEGKSPYGVMHMAGNVWQWCEDRYDSADDWRVLRGGSWFDSLEPIFRSSFRNWLTPGIVYVNRGFRCAARP